MASLATAVLVLASFFNMIDLTLAVVASFFPLFILLEIGRPYAVGVYVSASILSLILAPSKFAPACFLLLCGYYPLIKPFLDKFKIIVAYLLKLLLFNAVLTVILVLGTTVLGLPKDETAIEIGIYLLGNFTFVIYDFCILQIVRFYFAKIRQRLKVDKLLK